MKEPETTLATTDTSPAEASQAAAGPATEGSGRHRLPRPSFALGVGISLTAIIDARFSAIAASLAQILRGISAATDASAVPHVSESRLGRFVSREKPKIDAATYAVNFATHLRDFGASMSMFVGGQLQDGTVPTLFSAGLQFLADGLLYIGSILKQRLDAAAPGSPERTALQKKWMDFRIGGYSFLAGATGLSAWHHYAFGDTWQTAVPPLTLALGSFALVVKDGSARWALARPEGAPGTAGTWSARAKSVVSSPAIPLSMGAALATVGVHTFLTDAVGSDQDYRDPQFHFQAPKQTVTIASRQAQPAQAQLAASLQADSLRLGPSDAGGLPDIPAAATRQHGSLWDLASDNYSTLLGGVEAEGGMPSAAQVQLALERLLANNPEYGFRPELADNRVSPIRGDPDLVLPGWVLRMALPELSAAPSLPPKRTA